MLRLLVYITLFKVSIISSLPGYPQRNEYSQVIPNNRWAPPKQSDFHSYIHSVLMHEECGDIPGHALEDLYGYLESIIEGFVRKYCKNSRINLCERPNLFGYEVNSPPHISSSSSHIMPSYEVPKVEETHKIDIYVEPQADETPKGNRRFGNSDLYRAPKKLPPRMIRPPNRLPISYVTQPANARVTLAANAKVVTRPPPRIRRPVKKVTRRRPMKIMPQRPAAVVEAACLPIQTEMMSPKVTTISIDQSSEEKSPVSHKISIGSPPVTEESIEFTTTDIPSSTIEVSQEIEPVKNVKEYVTTLFDDTTTEETHNINVNVNDFTTTQMSESSESVESVPTMQTTVSFEISDESTSIEETTTPPVIMTTTIVADKHDINHSRKSSSSEEESLEAEIKVSTDIPSPTLDNLTKDDIEKIWHSEYETENVVTPPTIEDLGKIYKEGVVYLKEHPESSPQDLQKILLKNPDELVQYQEVISLLDDLKQKPEKLEDEYLQINTDSDELKYKTAIAFLKLRQRGKPEKNKLLIEMLETRTRELQATEKMLKGKLMMLNEEYKKINSAYGKIQKEEAETKDKVVVAVMKVPVTVDDGTNSNEEMEKVLSKFKIELEKNHQIVAQESVTVIQDKYSLTSDEKSIVITAATSGIDVLKHGMYSEEFSVKRGSETFFEVFDQLPDGYLESEQKIFGLNPYQDQTKQSKDISINPTRSLAAIRSKVLSIVARLTKGEIRVNKEKFFNYLIKILNLLIEKVKITPNKLIDNPQVSVFAAEESGNESEESEEK